MLIIAICGVSARQVKRSEEFSPVKNAPAPNAQCTRDTARTDVFRLHASWLRAAGADLSGSDEAESDMAIEISAQVSYAGEGLEAMRGVKVRGPLHLQVLQ